MTDEQKEEAFNAWKAGADYNAIMDLQRQINANKEIAKIDRGTEDINDDWEQVCLMWWRLLEVLKVPKKSKCKFYTSSFISPNLFPLQLMSNTFSGRCSSKEKKNLILMERNILSAMPPTLTISNVRN